MAAGAEATGRGDRDAKERPEVAVDQWQGVGAVAIRRRCAGGAGTLFAGNLDTGGFKSCPSASGRAAELLLVPHPF
ncbi:hypothetical protein [Oryza sativa Japonica Group]|uniref:Uncharacterized protein n=2 Tax=Oryza sativa subsp. japonica TaxID=39947 RepID=Q5N9I2_ORYSJ|nr:hypothetical protein [Oryza sativa Japonica Group]BAD82216.1 hypothetical protein [Oryza sativa Japonica Group]